MAPKITGVDHIELYVADQRAAADWYEHVLGLTPAESFAPWWDSGSGPLMVAVDDTTKLALFEQDSAIRGEDVSPQRIAFQTTGRGFLSFLERLETLYLTDDDGTPVRPSAVVDHDLSYSLYFTDPDGNRLELTTTEYAFVSAEHQ